MEEHTITKTKTKPDFAELEKIRFELEVGWSEETAHRAYKGREGSPIGQCYVSTLYAFEKLQQYDPLIAHGEIENSDPDHYWIEIGENIIDLTADQFNDRHPKIVYGTYSEFPNYIKKNNDSGFKRYLRLKNRINDFLKSTKSIHHHK